MGKLDNLQMEKINKIKLQVENSSVQLEEIIHDIVATYVDDLDKYVEYIDSRLCDKENPPTDADLDNFCLNLSTLIYFAGGMCEQLGIRDDIAKAVYKETYNTARDNLTKGTVQDKNTLAEIEAQQEQIITMVYNRAYKIVKCKVDNAQELLQSCKKVLSRRMQEQQLTNIVGNK